MQDGDQLKWVAKCREDDRVLIAMSNGYALQFPLEHNIHPSSRTARGVKVLFGSATIRAFMPVSYGAVAIW